MTGWLLAVDLDRTLVDDEVAARLLLQACIVHGVDTAALEAEKQRLEAIGESFFELQYLATLASPEQVAAVRSTFHELATDTPIVYGDVAEFLERARCQATPLIILTYGEERWQRLKLEAAGLASVPTIIMATKQKGPVIRSWQTPAGRYEALRGVAAAHVLLVDDKAVSFANLPEDCRGCWLQRPDMPLLPSQQGSTPPHVTAITSLGDVFGTIAK